MVFLRQLLRHGTGIASVTPSSRWMARELAFHVCPQRPQRILELGAGTGVVTREIQRRMHPQSVLLAVESEEAFADHLHRAAPHAQVLIDRVERAAARIAAAGPYDVVVSGLPFPSLTRRVQASVLRLLRVAAPDAVYSQLTEFPWIYMPLYKRCFARVRFASVPLNIPPGGVYHCGGPR